MELLCMLVVKWTRVKIHEPVHTHTHTHVQFGMPHLKCLIFHDLLGPFKNIRNTIGSFHSFQINYTNTYTWIKPNTGPLLGGISPKLISFPFKKDYFPSVVLKRA